jgi:dihydroorotate dehydrogenase electron transfer subunit
VHIRTSGTLDPLLRRPLSILQADPHKGHIQILVRAVGRGTELLAQSVPGNSLDLLGPLGNGFPMPEPGRNPLLVAGGVGVAPLVFLADALQNSLADFYVTGVYGAANEAALACWQEFGGRCEELELATDDGSVGTRGLVTDLLAVRLARGTVGVVYTCGPRPMMARVAALCAEAAVPCWASLEQFMGCGVGACLGCVAPFRDEPRHRRVCKDGPVFDAATVAWEDLAQ